MDHIVALPNAGMSSEARASVATLALAADFALPGAHGVDALEGILLAQFAGAASISAAAICAYFGSAGVTPLDLSDLVAQFAVNPTALHTALHMALQQHNDAGGVLLLCVANPEQLADALSGAALHPGAQGPLWLLRSGYSDDPPYGYYYDLAASSTQPVRILWSVVAGAEIIAAIALEAPTPPVDVAALLSTLSGAGDAMASAGAALSTAAQSVAAAQAAHATILASLGKG